MNKMGKRLLIACNNETDAKGLRDVFSGLSEIQITREVADGGGAVDAILGHGVDLMLLDLFLPGIDGLGVLEVVARLPEDRRPLIFVMTALPDDRLLYRIKDQVLYCFTKPLKYEIVQLRVLEILHMLDAEEEKPAPGIDLMERQIAAQIRAIGVPPHLKGNYYLRDAIRIYALAASPTELSITKDIYPVIAKIYNTRPPLVEHAIRNAIETTWTRGDLNTIHEYFGYTINDYKGKPSNLEFVAMMAQRALTYIQ